MRERVRERGSEGKSEGGREGGMEARRWMRGKERWSNDGGME